MLIVEDSRAIGQSERDDSDGLLMPLSLKTLHMTQCSVGLPGCCRTPTLLPSRTVALDMPPTECDNHMHACADELPTLFLP